MPAKHECHNCGRTVSGVSAIETVDYDLCGDPMDVWLCRECYGASVPPVDPGQPALGFADKHAAPDAA